jgi:hypothetical protein
MSIRYYAIQGTRGAYEAPRGLGDDHKVHIVEDCDPEQWRPLWDYEDYLPAWYRDIEQRAHDIGYDVTDYCCAWEFCRSIAEGRQPDVDVWMSLNISAVIPATHDSIAQGGVPVPIPDFKTEVQGGVSRHAQNWSDY